MAITLLNLGEERSFYTFRAGSLTEARARIEQLGPRDREGRHAATCDTVADVMQGLRVGVVPSSAQQAGDSWVVQSRVEAATLRYGFRFRLPRWLDVPASSRREWERFLRCLRTHESGHSTCSLPVMQRYQRMLSEARVMGMGNSRQAAEREALQLMRQRVRSLFSSLAADVQHASDIYDRRTVHGRSQGAQLNVGAESAAAHASAARNACGQPGCPGHRSPSHRCRAGARPGREAARRVRNACGARRCPGHRSPAHRCS